MGMGLCSNPDVSILFYLANYRVCLWTGVDHRRSYPLGFFEFTAACCCTPLDPIGCVSHSPVRGRSPPPPCLCLSLSLPLSTPARITSASFHSPSQTAPKTKKNKQNPQCPAHRAHRRAHRRLRPRRQQGRQGGRQRVGRDRRPPAPHVRRGDAGDRRCCPAAAAAGGRSRGGRRNRRGPPIRRERHGGLETEEAADGRGELGEGMEGQPSPALPRGDHLQRQLPAALQDRGVRERRARVPGDGEVRRPQVLAGLRKVRSKGSQG